MADPQSSDIPSFAGYLPPSGSFLEPGYLPPHVDMPPAPNTGNLFSAALMSGLHGAVAEGARTLQAGAQLVGATDTAKSLSDIADEHNARAQSYARPDLEAASWYSPSAFAYRVTQMVPTIGATALAGLAAAATAPEAAAGAVAATGLRAFLGSAVGRAGLGAAAASYPFTTGENVQRQISETGQLTSPGAALALGVPEAALQGILPARLETLFGTGIAQHIAHAAVSQGIAAGGTEAMTGLMGDSNRSFADRASDVVRQAVSGAALGGIIGGAFGGMRQLVGKSPAKVLDDPKAAAAAVDQALDPKAVAATAAPTAPTPRQNLATTLQGMAAEAGGDRGAAIARVASQLPGLGPWADQPPDALRALATRAEQGGHPGLANMYATLADAAERLRTRGPELTQQLAAEPPPAAAPVAAPAAAPAAAPVAEPVPAVPAPVIPREEVPPAAVVPGEPPAVAAAPAEPVAPAAAAPAAPPYVIDFTKGRFKEATAAYEAASPDAQVDMRRPLAKMLIAREAEGKDPTKVQLRWAKELGTSVDKLKEEFQPTPPVPEMKMTEEEYQRALRASMDEEGLPQDTRPLPSDAAVEAHEREVGTEPVRGPLAREVAPQHMPWYDEGYAGRPRGGNEAEQAAWDRGANDRMQADRAAQLGVAAPRSPEEEAIDDHVRTLGNAGTDEGKFKLALAAIMRDTDVKTEQAAEIARQYTGDDTAFKNKSAAVKAIQNEFTGRAESQALREEAGRAAPQPPTPEVVAKQAAIRAGLLPIKTSEDRTAALNAMVDQISKLPPSPAKEQLIDQMEEVTGKHVLAEMNPGYADTVNKNVMELRAKIPQPPADAAVSANAPSANAQAVQAPTGDLDKLLANARNAMIPLKRVIGDHPALAQHEAFLKAANQADTPEEYAAVANAHPEHPDLEAPGLSDIRNPPDKVRQYLNRYGEVLQEVRALSGDPDSYARTITSRDGLPVSQLDADMAHMHQRGVTLADAVGHIAERSADPEEAELASWMKPFIPENVKTLFNNSVTDREGEYFPKQKLSVLYNAANATVTTLHEAIHSVLSRALQGTSAAANAMRGIYDQLKDKGSHAGLVDVHEMVAETANPDFRAFLKSQYIQGTSAWDRFIDAARSVIGLPPRLFNAFDRIMSHGDDLMKEQARYPNDAWVGPDSYARLGNVRLKSVADTADQARGWFRDNWRNFSVGVSKVLLGWMRSEWIARDNSAVVPHGLDYIAAAEQYDPRVVALTQGQRNVAFRAFRALPERGQELIQKLLGSTTDYEIDPRKTLDQHSSIINEQDPAVKANRVNAYNEVVGDYNELKGIKGGTDVLNAYWANNNAKLHMTMLDKLLTQERALKSADPNYNFVDDFRTFDKLTNLHGSPQGTEGFFVNAVNSRLGAGDKPGTMAKYRDTLLADKANVDAAIQTATDAGASKEDIKKLTDQSNDIGLRAVKTDAVLKDVASQQKRAQEFPYAHLGRRGDYFGTGKLVLDADGNIDRNALTQFREFMDSKGFDDVAIMQHGGSDTFYSRVQDTSQMSALDAALREAQKLGYLSKDLPIKSGATTEVFPTIAPAAVRATVEALKALPLNIPPGTDQPTIDAINAAHGNQMANLQRIKMNTMQENSVGRLLTRRANVQGFSKNMIENQNYADEVMGRAIARMTLTPDINAALAGMAEDIKTANASDLPAADKVNASNAVAELNLRERLRQTYVPPSWFDGIRGFTHAMHIGLSPAYFLMLQSQNLTTGLPELAKTHGYAPAFKAMTTSLPQALEVMKSLWKSPDGISGGITYDALANNPKISPATRDFIMGTVSRGTFGALFTKLMTEESPLHDNTIVKASNAIGQYAELIPRVITALAADKLYRAEPYTDPRTGQLVTNEQFVDNAVKQSQGDWGSNLGARQTSRYGYFGAASPMMNQFMGWQIHMTTKIYSEIADAVSGNDPKTRAEARSWLIGHSAATAAFAGTLGLPFVSVAASVYDKLLDWVTNRDDYDITGSYRNFLAGTFGKDIGEIIARGLPRAVGMDFAHWGEGTIAPGSSLAMILTEKRKLEDAERDWAKSMMGPGMGDVFNGFAAARDVTNGDYLNGLIRIMPEVIKTPLETYRLSKYGFINNLTGQKLPMEASAYDKVLTLLAIDPAKQAEYQEVARDAAGLRTMRTLNSANIVRHMELAYTRGDQSMMNTWMAEAQKWQQDHPGLIPPQVGFQRELENHMRQSAMARGLGVPLGVSPRDFGARGALRYGNFEQPGQ